MAKTQNPAKTDENPPCCDFLAPASTPMNTQPEKRFTAPLKPFCEMRWAFTLRLDWPAPAANRFDLKSAAMLAAMGGIEAAGLAWTGRPDWRGARLHATLTPPAAWAGDAASAQKILSPYVEGIALAVAEPCPAFGVDWEISTEPENPKSEGRESENQKSGVTIDVWI